MKSTIEINGEQIPIVANAQLPILYRHHFGRDMMTDMRKLAKSYKQAKESDTPLDQLTDEVDFSILEPVTWLMLKLGGNDVGESLMDWLATIDNPMDIYRIGFECLALWNQSNAQTATVKKKGGQRQG